MKIAIVGMAFRFPGDIATEDSFWEAIKNSKDVVGTVPAERWGTDLYMHARRSEPGRSVTFSAGLLSRIDEFDAAFFGISPREAKNLDPQQRLLLEMAWEAMENGGQVPEKLAGSDCAVYIGISGLDYGLGVIDDLSSIDAYSMTGNTLSIAANRISYVFDLHGPSMAIDTACSSSMVALHQACASLRNGEAGTAIAGGINMLLHPYPFVGFTKASMLSAGGRCRTFDAAGDGYVRSEGGALLFLKPYDQALADGDPVHAVILATGVNTDGHKSGITIPSASAQTSLMLDVCDKAGVAPKDIIYVEAHGTGTAVGDPIESAAIGAAIGQARADGQPLYVGSVKSNMGHLESASGMAGLIKTVLCMKRRALAPSIHLDTPNPHIDFADLNLRVVTEFTPLPETARPLRMGVNSFGFGGANAHVVLEEHTGGNIVPALHDQPAPGQPAAHRMPPLFLSARHPEALKALALQYAERVRDTDAAGYYDLAHSAAHRRQFLEQRLAVHAPDQATLCERLRCFATTGHGTGIAQENQLPGAPKLAFVYSGNGSQWLGMGRRLLAEEPIFRQAIEEIDALLATCTDISLVEEFNADATASRLNLTEVAQPALFGIQVGITRVLRAHGVEADAALGHSAGEVAAAWATGALSLAQAVGVICKRSAAQAVTRGSGHMAAVALSEEQAGIEIAAAGHAGDLEVAAVNSPGAVTLSGSLHALEDMRARLEPRGVFFRLLDIDHAFHSRHMEPIRARVLKDLATLAPTAGRIPFFSTVTGVETPGADLGADYWWRNIRQPVQFGKAIAGLAGQGWRIFLEIGPHAIMQQYIGECLNASGSDGRSLATLKRGDDSRDRLVEAACRAILLGCPPAMERIFPAPGNYVPLPTYPWQRERHWHAQTSEGYDLIGRTRVHPLLGYRLKDAEAAWENHLDTQVVPYLADHVVAGSVVFPASAYVELALAASAQWFGGAGHEIEELEIRAPLVFDDEHARTVRFELAPADGAFAIKSRQRLSDDAWTLHAVGRLTGAPLAERPDARAQTDAGSPIDAATHYRLAHEIGLEYGPAFQAVSAVWPADGALTAALELPDSLTATAAAYLLHPVLLDACFQSLFDLFKDRIDAGERPTLLPVRVGRLRLFDPAAQVARCQTRLLRQGPRSVVADFQLLDADGRTVALASGCRFRAAPLVRRGKDKASEWVYTARLKPRQNIPMASPMPSVREMAETGLDLLREQAPELRRSSHFEQAMPLFDALVGAFAYEACLPFADSDGRLPEQLPAAAMGSPIQGLWNWLLGILGEDELVADTPDGRVLTGEVPATAEAIWLTILGDNPAYLPDLVLAGQVGLRLNAILAGRQDAGPLARSIRASHLFEQLLDSSPTYLAMNLMVEGQVRQLAETWPASRRLRILEVGGASRALTRRLLAHLPADRCDYVIADGDDDVLAVVQAEFADLAFVSGARLDPDTFELAGHDQQPGLFDLILAGHSLHQASQPLVALAGLKRHLAVNGRLLLLERDADRLSDLSFGLAADWWSGQGRHLHTPETWLGMLRQSGYAKAEILQEPMAGETANAGVYAVLASNHGSLGNQVAQPPEAADWLLLADQAGPARAFAETLRGRLVAAGQRVRLAQAVDGDTEPCDHVVHLLGLATGPDAADLDLMAVQERRCIATLDLIHTGLGHHNGMPAKLWLVTAGGAVVSNPDGTARASRNKPSQAALWGFGRVIANEHPELQCTLVDLQHDHLEDEAAASLCQELLFPDGEDEVILSPDCRRVTRMQRLATPPAVAGGEGDDIAGLDFGIPGQLRNLHWRRLPAHAPGPDEIEIRPEAVGLNFRDVMYAMGLLSDEAVENGFAGPTLGMELSGVVTRVGAEVREFAPGDAVIAFAPASFAQRVVTKAGSAVRKPEAWSFEEAATVPTVFFTVYYALHHLARLEPGEKILIHGAAGGVGIAAIQLARYLGAEVFATAGSDEKRDFVRLLGADHVMNSRNLAYADDIMRITGGSGIDVVLNSLAGEAINRNFRVLKPFGRFLELGKRDFYENTKIGLRPFKDNVTYHGIDADQLMVERPQLTARLFREVMALFEDGALKPLPYRAFPAGRIVDAFRYMQQSRQIGKIVVTFGDERLPVAAATEHPADLALDRDATYLVTGGVGGFGLETALWLAGRGAGHLVLLGRRGADSPEAAQAVAKLAAAGAQAHIKTCDVADAQRLSEVIQEIGSQLPPLKGIVHAAMVLDDGLIRNLDARRFRAVLKPKMVGAWNLHRLTTGLPLDFFVVYSSATTFIGNPGQANYVAANLYLESLVAWRRSQGLPGTSVCWGALDDVGYLARNEAVKDSLQARLGGPALQSGPALAQLGGMIASGRSGIAVIDFDWHTVSRFLPSTRSPRFDELRRTETGTGGADPEAQDIHALVAGHTEEEVRAILRGLLTGEVAQILRLPAERIDADRSLHDLGMDSLMGVELALGIEKRLGINLPIMALSDGPTIARIAERMAHQLKSGSGPATDDVGHLRASIEGMAVQHGVQASAEDIDETMRMLRRPAASGGTPT